MRNYKRKRPQQWADKDRRMTLAARLRGEGRSLREIGAELRISPATAMRDLRRWDEAQAAAPAAAPANVFHLPVSTRPARGELKHPAETRGETPRTTGEVLGLSVREEQIARAVAYFTKGA